MVIISFKGSADSVANNFGVTPKITDDITLKSIKDRPDIKLSMCGIKVLRHKTLSEVGMLVLVLPVQVSAAISSEKTSSDYTLN